eukprot:scaffold1501_cov352-Pavlova_lutheri.AAC.22
MACFARALLVLCYSPPAAACHRGGMERWKGEDGAWKRSRDPSIPWEEQRGQPGTGVDTEGGNPTNAWREDASHHLGNR